ncbi:hypothetical protein [Pasteurella multocida]|uniref:hypothetical protein n=1 Tax=Pasteurella multocida TaxID=747 RepID=UPI00064CBCBE|nr:hypothetical protein [Pasteurella multocida]KLT47931.1 hypothetical protein PVACC_05155 [Pasteurella multocida subsp. multocida]KLT51618.1 hypothetical protein PMMV1_05155 [Pasteurella multocida subsp. multocida]KLT56431.1 hypothetical protein ISLM_05150 [Pasteurella multocida subsp. multocida]KLT61837.1 hypothetical protein PESH_05155 [Pasteurella multocida subsp. multocida]KLU31212.1 hypothetical protein ATTK_03305 [Pasteurella multocida subsp. multocida]
MNFEITQRLLTKLRAALQRQQTLSATDYEKQEEDLTAKLAELTSDTEPNGTALVDTARELQTLRANRHKHMDKVLENSTQIAKLKYLLAEQVASISIDEQIATLEEMGL